MHLYQGNCSDWRVCFLRPDTEWNAAGTKKRWHKSVKLYTGRDSAALNLSLCRSDFIPDMRNPPAAEFAVHFVKSRSVYKTRLLWALFELPSMSAAAPLLRPAQSHQLTQLWVEKESKEKHTAFWVLLWTDMMGVLGMQEIYTKIWCIPTSFMHVVDMTGKQKVKQTLEHSLCPNADLKTIWYKDCLDLITSS